LIEQLFLGVTESSESTPTGHIQNEQTQAPECTQGGPGPASLTGSSLFSFFLHLFVAGRPNSTLMWGGMLVKGPGDKCLIQVNQYDTLQSSEDRASATLHHEVVQDQHRVLQERRPAATSSWAQPS
jgi:hypothetical protein